MAYFDRFDLCEAYYLIEAHYSHGGWLQERPSNVRRMEATHVQLGRLQFRPSPLLSGVDKLTENGAEIYHNLEERYGFVGGSNNGNTKLVD